MLLKIENWNTELQESLTASTLTALSALEERIYPDLTTFLQKVNQQIGHGHAPACDLICQAASVGRRKFIEKLGWLMGYQSDTSDLIESILGKYNFCFKQTSFERDRPNSVNDSPLYD